MVRAPGGGWCGSGLMICGDGPGAGSERGALCPGGGLAAGGWRIARRDESVGELVGVSGGHLRGQLRLGLHLLRMLGR